MDKCSPKASCRRLQVALQNTLLGLTLVFSGASVFAQESSPHRVLLIYSSTDIGAWEQIYNTTVLQALAESSSTLVAPEFLSLVGASEQSNAIKAQSLQLQYSDEQADLIISVFPEAATFVRDFADVIAPSAAHLYVLPGSDVLDATLDTENELVIASSVGIATLETLKLMDRLLPELSQVYLVGGNGEGDRSYMNRVLEAVEPSGIEAPTTVLQGLAPDDLIAALRDAPDNSAILLSTYDSDVNGMPQRTVFINDMLKGEIDLPVFSMFDTQIGRGAVGGNMSAAMQYASVTAEIARSYLEGNNPPAMVNAPTEYMFDGERLDQFGINRGLLPANSIVLNDPPDFWRDNFWLIVGVCSVIVVQLFLIALLLNAIARRKLAEEELQTTQKMEALGTLAGGIAHDFNNILMAIIANAELASMKLGDGDKVEERLGKIVSASNRAKHLVSQILMFSRQSASQAPEPIDVCALLTESTDQVRSFLPKECSIQLICDKDLPLVSADSGQLHQCIINISINAQHAMSNNGCITVEARKTRISSAKEIYGQSLPAGDYVTISISDTGSGISEQDLQHIFEPFYSTKPQGKGTGLGLAMVTRIMRNHGGFINVASEENKGSTFTLYLKPSNKKFRAQQPEAKAALKEGSGEKIMLVDDDDMVLEGVGDALEKLGYKVSLFRSSVSALKEFRKNSNEWDLLFTDLSMPEMDGVRLSAQVRLVREDLPVILYTGYLEATEISELQNIRILNKPCSSEEITSAIAAEIHA